MDVVRHRRLWWLGHVGRMPHHRLPIQMLFSKLEGKGVRGATLKVWNECVRKDLYSIRLHLDWWRKCKDRNGWRTAISKVLQNAPSP